MNIYPFATLYWVDKHERYIPTNFPTRPLDSVFLTVLENRFIVFHAQLAFICLNLAQSATVEQRSTTVEQSAKYVQS